MPDNYTLHLLGMAVEACVCRFLALTVNGSTAAYVTAVPDVEYGTILGDATSFPRPTLADALAALLRDLGVEAPERPTVERMASIAMSLEFIGGDRLKFLRSADRLAVLALLEEGS